jgi:Xaa-Pro aminopeptidase
MKVGVTGWKYYGAAETATPDTWSEAPSFIIDTLRAIVGDGGSITNANALLMHASTGMRAINEIEQIAAFEFAACHTSEAVKSVVRGVRPGMTEFEAARKLAPIGLPLSCHTMLSAGRRASFGLGSPSHRPMERGDQFTTAFGVWGALNCRAGWLVADAGELPAGVQDYFERLVAPYFLAVAEWYQAIGIGVSGGELDAIVKRRLGDPFFGLFLPPGHLIHVDEWMNTPIYPGSSERLQSGQAIQVDIIPATGTPYFTSNIEDGIALLDAPGRAAFAERYPEAWGRIEARRAFMADVVGIRLKDEVLPLCNIPAALPPFILSPDRIALLRP